MSNFKSPTVGVFSYPYQSWFCSTDVVPLKELLSSSKIVGPSQALNRVSRYLPDVAGRISVPVPQPRTSLTLDETLAQDAPLSIWSGIVALPEGCACAVLVASAAPATGAELIH